MRLTGKMLMFLLVNVPGAYLLIESLGDLGFLHLLCIENYFLTYDELVILMMISKSYQ